MVEADSGILKKANAYYVPHFDKIDGYKECHKHRKNAHPGKCDNQQSLSIHSVGHDTPEEA